MKGLHNENGVGIGGGKISIYPNWVIRNIMKKMREFFSKLYSKKGKTNGK